MHTSCYYVPLTELFFMVYKIHGSPLECVSFVKIMSPKQSGGLKVFTPFFLSTFCPQHFSKTVQQFFMKLSQEKYLGGVDLPLAIHYLIMHMIWKACISQLWFIRWTLLNWCHISVISCLFLTFLCPLIMLMATFEVCYCDYLPINFKNPCNCRFNCHWM